MGANALLLRCWSCQRPCRALYGYRVGSDGRYYRAELADWQCRKCAALSYSSEGSALIIWEERSLDSLSAQPLRFPSLRPDLWLPDVFSSPEDAERAGLI